jgi:hypothetical protein
LATVLQALLLSYEALDNLLGDAHHVAAKQALMLAAFGQPIEVKVGDLIRQFGQAGAAAS